MDILVVADGHYYIHEDNVYVDAVFDYNFYSRYLSVFDEVYAIVRAELVNEVPKKGKLASGKNVHFLPIPASKGAFDFLRTYFKTRKLIKNYIKNFDHAIFRVPGVVANAVSGIYIKNKEKKFAIEVVVDPWEYFAKGTIKGFIRPFVRLFWTLELRNICRKANGVSYVTEKYLQKRYPCKAIFGEKDYFTASYSSVELPDDLFSQPRVFSDKKEWLIGHVAASFTSYGKGHIVLMDALKIVRDRGYNVRVNFIGDGPLKKEFESYANKKKLDGAVSFLGKFPNGIAVREELRKCDFFVFPTVAEGLPRCVLEAMAEGLPVLSSPVCGIPEILSQEYLIDYNRADLYAEKIIELINNPEIMTQMSKDNIEISLKFRSSILEDKRTAFYQMLRNS